MRIGLIGPGSFALRGVLPAIERVEAVELAATWGRREDAARQVAAQFGGAVCATVEELCARDDVDVLFVVTVPAAHAGLLPAVIASGKPFICDKPVCRNAAELAPLVEAVERRGTLHAVNHQFRYEPHMVALADLVRSGALGRVFMSTYNLNAGFALDPRMGPSQKQWSFHHSLAEGGGLLPQVMSHHIDLHRVVLGEMTPGGASLATIVAERPQPPETPGGPVGPMKRVEVEDCAAVTARLAGGGLASMALTSVATSQPDLRWLIHGEKGSISYHAANGFFGGSLLLSEGWMGEPREVAVSGGHEREVAALMGDMIVELLIDFRQVHEGRREKGHFATLRDELAVWNLIEAWRENGRGAG